MRTTTLQLNGIPLTRKVRGRGELQRTFVKDMAALREGGSQWVRTTMRATLDEALAAGNPSKYTEEVNGVRGKGFHPGAISQAHNSARVRFVPEVAKVASRVHMTLLQLIWKTYPRMRRKELTKWSWYIGEEWLFGPKKPLRRLGGNMPQSLENLGIYDVLILAPDEAAAQFAWFANRYAVRRKVFASKRKRRKDAVSAERRARGIVGETTHRTRGPKPRPHVAGFRIQARIIGEGLTSRASRATKVPNTKGRALPIIRVSYYPALFKSVQWE